MPAATKTTVDKSPVCVLTIPAPLAAAELEAAAAEEDADAAVPASD